MKQQPFASPGEALEHHGVKGQRWGVRKKEETSDREPAQKDASGKLKSAPTPPNFEERVQQLSRTDRPQTIGPSGQRTSVSRQEVPKQGLTREQKMLLTFGAVAAAGAGYYAYNKYLGGNPPSLSSLEKGKLQDLQEIRRLDQLTLPKHWDVSGLKNGPISKSALGNLAGGEFNAKYDDLENLVINTSRGYADILPKNGLPSPFAKAQHDSVIRVLEEMREKYPTIRNMNIEVAPMSAFKAVGDGANMCVLPMGPGEARLLYNDTMQAPTQAIIRANKSFLPGLAKKDYVAYHEMGHLFAVASGQLPPAKEFLSDNPPMKLWKTRNMAEPILHRKMFAKHGFSYKELQKISGYASTQPAEAMAELVGHYLHPEMRQKLTPDQILRAQAMINEMGGL
jgi:hypothetical protein